MRSPRFWIWLLAVVPAMTACSFGDDGDDDDTEVPNDDDDTAPECRSGEWEPNLGAFDEHSPICEDEHGNGALGQWITDAWGRPAWRTTLPPDDARWNYPNSNGTSRDVWHFIGNENFKAMVHRDGAVELMTYPRTATWLNKRHLPAGQTVGGWAELEMDGTRQRIGGHEEETVTWGMGYVTFERTIGTARISRRLYVGDDSGTVMAETRIEAGDTPVEGVLHEDWDFNYMHQLFFPLASEEGVGMAWTARMGQIAGKYTAEVAHSTEGVSVTMIPGPAAQDTESFSVLPSAIALSAPAPAKVCHRTSGDGTCEDSDATVSDTAALVLSLETPVSVVANASASFVSRFGWDAGTPATGFPTLEDVMDAQPEIPFTLDVPSMPWVARETAWHSHRLQSLAFKNRRFNTTFVDQGSAYLFMQGLSGAVRDWVINALALIPINPELARSTLVQCLKFTDPDGYIHYAMAGASTVTEAAIHDDSTDLDLWLLWGVMSYVEATRDFGFLGQQVAYYPPEGGVSATVLDHMKLALTHLRDTTGVGEHGLIRVGTGDWSDGVVLYAPDRGTAVELGESNFNTGFAAYLLPKLVEFFDRTSPGYRDEIMAFQVTNSEALEASWIGDRYLRGWDGQGGMIGGPERFFLESQLFPLMRGFGGIDRINAQVAAIEEHLDSRSDNGAVLVYPPKSEGNIELLVEGWDVNGGIWHAMNMLLTAGYATLSPQRAWASWQENTLARHAETYPNLWFGVTSGPDSYNAPYADHPGATFWHPATSMAEFPTANSNAHAGPLWSAARLAGLIPSADGWLIEPAIDAPSFRLTSTLADLVWTPEGMAGRFRVQGTDPVEFGVRAPDGATGYSGVGDGAIIYGYARFALTPANGEVEWELRWEQGP